MTEPSLHRLPFDPITEASRHWHDRGWGDAAGGMAAVTSIVRAEQLLVGRINRSLRPLGLTFSRYEVLMLLLFSRSGELPLGKMGERLQVRAGSITNAVDRLEADALVDRVPHPTDGRGTLAVLTDAGREVAERATKILNDEVFSTVGLSPSELGRLVTILTTLRRGHNDFP